MSPLSLCGLEQVMGLSFSTGNRDYWCVIAKGNAEHVPKAYSVTVPTQTVTRIRIMEPKGHRPRGAVVATLRWWPRPSAPRLHRTASPEVRPFPGRPTPDDRSRGQRKGPGSSPQLGTFLKGFSSSALPAGWAQACQARAAAGALLCPLLPRAPPRKPPERPTV